MAHNSYIKPGGIWPLLTIVTKEIMELLDAAQFKAINGDDGGTWAPAEVITVGGAGLTVTGPFTASNASITIPSGKTLTIASGGSFVTASGSTTTLGGAATLNATLTVSSTGKILVASGGVLEVASGGAMDLKGGMTVYNTGAIQVLSGSLLACELGSTATFAGETYFTEDEWPRVAPVRDWEIHSLEICNVTYVTAGPPREKPEAWHEASSILGSGTMIRTNSASAAGHYHWIKFKGLMDGATIEKFEVVTKGESGGAGFTRPTYRVVRYKGTAAIENVTNLVTDVHAADASDWNTDVLTTELTPVVGKEIVDATYTYALIVNHVYQGTGAEMLVFDAVARGTISELRWTN